MRWRGRRESSNIEDVRGSGGGGFGSPGGFGRNPIRIPMGGRAGGGLSLTTIIILVVIYFALRACGVDPLGMDQAGSPGGVPGGGGQIAQEEGQPANDEMKQFVATILAETEALCRNRPGFMSREAWRAGQVSRMGAAG